MGDLNISRQFAQRLGDDTSRRLVKEILQDSEVSGADKSKLEELKKHLETATVDPQDEASKKELIENFTNLSTILGVNVGTDKEILRANLQRLQSFQNGMKPNEVNFDGMSVTMDGWLGDTNRVIRLRDLDEAATPTATPVQPVVSNGETTGVEQKPVVTTEEPAEAAQKPVVTTPAPSPAAVNNPLSVAQPYVPQESYSPTVAPAATSPSATLPADMTQEQLAALGPTQQTYSQSVTNLQTQATTLRNLLNDPNAVSDTQLRDSLRNFAEKDSGKAFLEVLRFNPNLLDDMQKQGLLSESQRKNLNDTLQTVLGAQAEISSGNQSLGALNTSLKSLEEQLAKVDPTKPELKAEIQSKISAVKGQIGSLEYKLKTAQSRIDSNIDLITKGDPSVSGVNSPTAALTKYLSATPSPLSGPQLNAYRAGLVKSADNYIANPNAANFSDMRTNLYSNLYAFEKGVPASQEQAYGSFKEAIIGTGQKQETFNHQLGVLTGATSGVLSSAGTAGGLAQSLQLQKDGAAAEVADFVNKNETVVAYLKAYPNQYEGQAGDIAAIEGKLKALKASSNPQEQLTLINQLSNSLDEVYIKTGINKGSIGEVDATKAILEQAKTKLTSEEDQRKMDLLINNPELVRILPKASEYSDILKHLQDKGSAISPKEAELKAALESGDSAKVSAIFAADFFSSIGIGSLGFAGSYFGGFNFGMSLFQSPAPAPILNMSSALPLDVSLAGVSTPGFDQELNLGIGSGITGLNSSAFNLNTSTPSFITVPPPAPPRPLWASIPGGQTRADNLATELAQLSPERREALVAALKSPDMVGMSEFIQRVTAEQPDLKKQLDKVQVAESAKEAIASGHWDESSVRDSAQTALQTQIQSNLAVQGELTVAKAELEKLIKNPDLASPVKAKLESQLSLVNKTLAQIKEGKYPPADPLEAAKLDPVIQALATEGKPAGMSVSDRFMLKATIDVLEDIKSQPQAMAALEASPSFKGLDQVFAKKDGVYTFPQEMQDLLQNPDLSKEAAQLLMLQANRVGHLVAAVPTRGIAKIEEAIKVGAQQTAQGNGGGEIMSGLESLRSLNAFKQNMVDMQGVTTTAGELPQIESATWLNSIANQMGPIDLSTENRQLRASVNNAFSDNVSMAKNLAQDSLSQITDAAKNTQLSQGKTGLTELLNDSRYKELLGPALKEEGLDINNLGTIDAAKLAQIESAIATAKLKLDPQKTGSPIIAAQIQKLDELEAARKTVNELVTTDVQARGNLGRQMETAKSQLIDGVREAKATLQAAKIPTPNLDKYLADPNSVSLDDVLAEMKGVQGSSRVRAAANNADRFITQYALIGKAQTELLSAEGLKPDTGAALIVAIGTGAEVSRITEQFAADIERVGIQAATQIMDLSMTALKEKVDSAVTDPGVAAALFTTGGHTSNGSPPSTSGTSTGSPDSGTVPGGGPQLPRFAQDVLNVLEVGKRFHAAGIEREAIDPATVGVHTYSPPGFDNWYPGKFLNQIVSGISDRREILVNTPPAELPEVLNEFRRGDQVMTKANNTMLKGMEDYLKQMSPALEAAGLGSLDLSYIDDSSEPLSDVSGTNSSKANISQQAQGLVDKADALANAILSPKPTVDGKDALSGLLKDFLENIRNLDFQTRKLVMAQFAKRLMNNMITKLYGEKSLENAKYHEKSLDQFKARMKEGIERALEAAEAQASSGQAAMAVGGDLGSKTGGAVADAGISDQALRDEASQFLEPAVQDGVLSRVQKQKILQALFDGSSVTGQEGVMSMLTRFQQVSSVITQ